MTPKSPLASFRTSPTKFELLFNEDVDLDDAHQKTSQRRSFAEGKKGDDKISDILLDERWEEGLLCTTAEAHDDDVSRYVEKQKAEAKKEMKLQSETLPEHLTGGRGKIRRRRRKRIKLKLKTRRGVVVKKKKK